MSPALPTVSGDETVRALEQAGFRRVSQKGSHVKMRSPDGRTAIVPRHEDLAPGTLRSILKQAGLTPEAFRLLLR